MRLILSRVLATLMMLVIVVAGCERTNSRTANTPGHVPVSANSSPSTRLVNRGHAAEPGTPPNSARRYLALGDSYTIGESVPASDRWPNLLVNHLRKRGLAFEPPIIIAVTGWTTGDLLRALDTQPPTGPFDLVTLMIGVNNQYQTREGEEFRREFADLLDRSIKLARDEPARVVAVSIPDWGQTPFGESADRDAVAREVNGFNTLAFDIATSRGVHWIDVTSTTRAHANDRAMNASDGLHYARPMHELWAEQVERAVAGFD